MMMQAREAVAPQFSLKSGKQPIVYYLNSFHCFTRILQEEGIRGLFAGLTANLFRGIAGSLMLVGYDECKRFFGDKAS
jgi:solute carrier family 25 (adenine nucleotide translocator) protein 4/5/6/31